MRFCHVAWAQNPSKTSSPAEWSPNLSCDTQGVFPLIPSQAWSLVFGPLSLLSENIGHFAVSYSFKIESCLMVFALAVSTCGWSCPRGVCEAHLLTSFRSSLKSLSQWGLSSTKNLRFQLSLPTLHPHFLLLFSAFIQNFLLIILHAIYFIYLFFNFVSLWVDCSLCEGRNSCLFWLLFYLSMTISMPISPKVPGTL